MLSGAREILEDLAGRPDVTSVLLTGNTEAGARVKLRHDGLDRYLAAGAFADETTDRIAIARKGWEPATRLLGTPPRPDRSFVIGDTPHGTRCTRTIGVRAVAVATGAYSAARLGAHQPWWVVKQLPPPGEFAARLGLLGERDVRDVVVGSGALLNEAAAGGKAGGRARSGVSITPFSVAELCPRYEKNSNVN